MDMASPPTSARSCSSMASDLIREDRPSLTNLENMTIKRCGSGTSEQGHDHFANIVRRRGSGTSINSDIGEEYMDVVFDNLFGLHNEIISEIESSIVAESPKISPRPEEYSSSSHLPSSNVMASLSQRCGIPSPILAKDISSTSIEEDNLAMSLVSNSSGGIVQLAPATIESKMQLQKIHDSQQRLLQKNCVIRKKTILLQVCVEVYEEDTDPKFEQVGPNYLNSLSVMPPPVPSISPEKRDTMSPKKALKDKSKDKDKGKRNNLMRHIYKTNCNAYRVQISVGSKVNPNGKFSRNARLEKDALWLCELAILFIHQPSSAEYLFQWGNYDYLLQYEYCDSYDDYVNKLLHEFVDLTERGLIKPPEFETLRTILLDFFPSFSDFLASLNISDILLAGKAKKKQNSSKPKSKKDNEDAMTSSATKGKVAVPILQFPVASSEQSSSLLLNANRENKKIGLFEPNFGEKASLESAPQVLYHHRHIVGDAMVQKKVTRDGKDGKFVGNQSESDIDSKRRRVPSSNPSHQSPRTLEILQQHMKSHNQV